jgi:hypothetical protein
LPPLILSHATAVGFLESLEQCLDFGDLNYILWTRGENFYSLWDKPFLNYLTHKDLNFESRLTQSSLYVKSQSSQSLAHLESQILLGLQQRRTVCEAVLSLLFNLLQNDAARTHKMTTLLPPGPRKAKAMPNFSITWALTHSMCSLAEKACISGAKQNPRCPQSTLNPRKSPQIPIIVLSPYVKPIPLAKIALV